MSELLDSLKEAMKRGYTVRIETRGAMCASDIQIVVSDGHYSRARYFPLAEIEDTSYCLPIGTVIARMIEEIEVHKARDRQ